jgi:acetolactate synthase-1/2/3 large subunit
VTFDIPATKLVQIDIDGFEVGRNYPVEVGLVADARAALADLLAALEARGAATDYADTPYFAELVDLRRQWDEHLAPMRTTDYRPMTNSRALVELRAAMPRETIFVTDSSNPANQAFNELELYEPKTSIVCGGMSGIGFGVPAAIGVQKGMPDAPVVALVGDGSFLQSGTELATAAMLDLPIVVVVLNNGGWEAIRDLQTRLFGAGRNISTDWKRRGEPYFADVAGMARALGCEAQRIEDPEELGAAVRAALADRTRGPVVLEAMSAAELPYAAMHPTGWWDITVPAYLGDTREDYVTHRGF